MSPIALTLKGSRDISEGTNTPFYDSLVFLSIIRPKGPKFPNGRTQTRYLGSFKYRISRYYLQVSKLEGFFFSFEKKCLTEETKLCTNSNTKPQSFLVAICDFYAVTFSRKNKTFGKREFPSVLKIQSASITFH